MRKCACVCEHTRCCTVVPYVQFLLIHFSINYFLFLSFENIFFYPSNRSNQRALFNREVGFTLLQSDTVTL